METVASTNPSGGGQLKKLFFNKRISDSGTGYVWRISTTKVALWFVACIIGLLILYSFFAEGGQGPFLQDVLFYALVIMIMMLIGWIVCRVILKSRKLFTGFLIGWILVLACYILLDLIIGKWLGLMEFSYGPSALLIFTTLAVLGSSRIDGAITKDDVLFSLLVLVILLAGNYPVFQNGTTGFFAEVDHFLGWIVSKLSFINPEDLYAN